YRTPKGEEIVALVNATRPLGEGGRLRGPLVIIPPAFGKTKETYCALALALTETFRRHGRDVLVVRYDDIRSVGESHKDPIRVWPFRERGLNSQKINTRITNKYGEFSKKASSDSNK
ncbi:MAG TPA: hypothetical protein VLB84_08255, partial [Bacteroidia bacterium]|nr:hypothetical protein [Bacteroidia bacterium]